MSSSVGSATRCAAGAHAATIYTYDELGNRVRIEDQNGVKDYGYDKSNRLITVKPVPFNLAQAEAFVYDRNGNRRFDREAKDYKYDGANRLLENTAYTYTHDQLGNLTSRTEIASSTTLTCSYNPENQLYNVLTADGTKVEYKYDPLGRRMEKLMNGVGTQYLYDGQNIIADLDAKGSLITIYTNGPGIDEPLIMSKADKSTYFYHADALGSIKAITDTAGRMAETYQYKSYGEPTIRNVSGQPIQESTIGNSRLFTAREVESGLKGYYYRTRYYEWGNGMFFQEDKKGFSAGNLNLYAYAMNQPINYRDVFGEDISIVEYTLYGFGILHFGYKVTDSNSPTGYSYYQFSPKFDSTASLKTIRDILKSAVWVSNGAIKKDYAPVIYDTTADSKFHGAVEVLTLNTSAKTDEEFMRKLEQNKIAAESGKFRYNFAIKNCATYGLYPASK